MGKTDWEDVLRTGDSPIPYLSIRGRNLLFFAKIADVLGFDSKPPRSLAEYKERFDKVAVRDIHDAVLDIWPPDTDIASVLQATEAEVSGLYIGDYDLDYILRGIVRHSIYANKILVVDPFVYPRSVRDEFNPIVEPGQYRAQTLRNVNFFMSLLPWIEAGIVELIRTPADFDPKLMWESLKRQEKKFEEVAELKEAIRRTSEELRKRHFDKQALEMLLLQAPDDYIRDKVKALGLETEVYTADDFLDYVHRQREHDPNFLGPLEKGKDSGQLFITSSGASYDVAQLTASLTKSYLVTDLYSKWREIELDRKTNSAENRVWSPFAKAVQETNLKYLNNLQLSHALDLRKEQRLEKLRGFLLRVWREARTEVEFDESNAILFAQELKEEVALAEEEWKQIQYDLAKWIGAEAGTGLLAAGPLIANGHGLFLAAAAVSAGASTLAATYYRKRRFPDRFPASFFMNIGNGF